MKYFAPLILFLICLIVSCGPSAEEKAAIEKCIQDEMNTESAIRANLKNTFDKPFPKWNRNLSRVLGDTLQIYGRCRPLSFKVISNRKSNLIINYVK